MQSSAFQEPGSLGINTNETTPSEQLTEKVWPFVGVRLHASPLGEELLRT